MRYHGGKTRLGKCIAGTIQTVLNDVGTLVDGYVEPFCGMCGVLVHVVQTSNLVSYAASDNNSSVIEMWKDLREGWRPDISTFDEKRFQEMKGDGQSNAQKGFFGHAVTFGALYFQSYRPELTKLLDYSSKDVVKRSLVLKDVVFRSCDYKKLLQEGTKNKLVYCDPPYEKRSRYYDEFNHQLSFDSTEFWKVCEELSIHNVVVISEQKQFFDQRSGGYAGNIRVLKLPVKQNRFGATKRESGEYLCVMTHLPIAVGDICCSKVYTKTVYAGALPISRDPSHIP
jgi:site-specific DNA-adenine methylase